MSRLVEKPQTTWSRRRAAVQAEAEADKTAAGQAEIAKTRAELSRKSDAEILEKLDLQVPEQMQSGDNFAAFMKAEVPQRLRRRALRTLWRTNPVLACVDDLVDYGEDFKAEWTGAGLVKTTYQVGKGMLAHIKEMERQQAEKLAAQNQTAAVDDDPVTAKELDLATPAETPSEILPTAAITAPNPTEDVQTDDIAQPIFRQRMRFEFDEVHNDT